MLIVPLAVRRKEVLWFANEDFLEVVHNSFEWVLVELTGQSAPAAVKSKSGITRFARPPAFIPFFS